MIQKQLLENLDYVYQLLNNVELSDMHEDNIENICEAMGIVYSTKTLLNAHFNQKITRHCLNDEESE